MDKQLVIFYLKRHLLGIVGLLLAALYDPVWTSAIHQPSDFALGLAAFGLLAFWKMPPWIVVVLSALGAEGIEVASSVL